MLKISKFLIATALATLIAAPALAQSLAYVGNSDAKFVGSGGVLDFHAACNDTFPGSQFCTSEDIIRGGAIPFVANDQAWVHPIVVGFDTGAELVVLYSGAQVPSGSGSVTVTCQCWSSSASNLDGLVVTVGGNFESGKFVMGDCNVQSGCSPVNQANCGLPVACCKKKAGQKGK